jgi:hypothetical protein
VLATQRGEPLAAVHAFMQKPQFASDDVVSVSQVTARSPSHSPRPALQGEAWQAPLTQICPLLPQVFVQPPQCEGSLAVLVSQPLAASPSQSP